MKEKYHPYVFKNGKFVGNFEEMYKNETTEYDSWYQNDLRDYGHLISLVILSKYNFQSIIDVGCGKGLFTSLLKKSNNTVVGIDTSLTAVKKARASFKDIDWQCFTVEGDTFFEIFKVYPPTELLIFKEVLSYMKGWKSVLKQSKNFTKYIFISLDLPEKPTGYVKSFKELLREVKKYYVLIVKVEITTTGNQILILGKVKE